MLLLKDEDIWPRTVYNKEDFADLIPALAEEWAIDGLAAQSSQSDRSCSSELSVRRTARRRRRVKKKKMCVCLR